MLTCYDLLKINPADRKKAVEEDIKYGTKSLLEKLEKPQEKIVPVKKIEQENKQPVKNTVLETKANTVEKSAEDKPVENKVDEKSTVLNDTDEKITMQDRKINPIRIIPKEEKESFRIKVKTSEDNALYDDPEMAHRVEHLKHALDSNNIRYNNIRKMPTGLLEVDVIRNDNSLQTISVDLGILYDNMIKFYYGRIEPNMEYNVPAIYFTKESLYALANGQPIDSRYCVPAKLIALNKVFNVSSLKEFDDKKRDKVLEDIYKELSLDSETYAEVYKYTNGIFRFEMTEYVNENTFTITTSNNVLASNLNPNSKLKTNRVYELKWDKGKKK